MCPACCATSRTKAPSSRTCPPGGLEQALSFAEGRMKKKVLGASEALDLGVEKVIFADGRVEHPLLDALAGKGTVNLGRCRSLIVNAR